MLFAEKQPIGIASTCDGCGVRKDVGIGVSCLVGWGVVGVSVGTGVGGSVGLAVVEMSVGTGVGGSVGLAVGRTVG